METRVYITDSDIVQDNSIGEKHKEWSRNETAPDTKNTMPQDFTEAVKQMLYPELVKEIKQLKEEKQEYIDLCDSQKTTIAELRIINSDQALKIRRKDKKLADIQTMYNAQIQSESTSTAAEQHFVFDMTHFDENASVEQINTLFLKLQKLAEVQTAPDEYLIDNASAVVPVFVMLRESTKINPVFRYHGNMQDFCTEWNVNVASRIADKKRSETLTCKHGTFKAELGRAPLKGSSPATWKVDAVSKNNKKKMGRCFNIKKHMERLFT